MSSGQANNLIPVTLLTGFLGSGKTTVLNHLVRQPELHDALVIINEFGEMALDHLLIAHSTENLVMEMSSGCLCCNIRGDLVKTLRDITWRFSREGRRQFGRVLIETTGLADPAPILHTLMTHPQIASRYRLDGIVTAVDLTAGADTLDRHPEAVKQAALADVLLLTKADQTSEDEREPLLRRLDDINPAAPRWPVHQGIVPPAGIMNLGLFGARGRSPDIQRWLGAAQYAPAPAEQRQAGGDGLAPAHHQPPHDDVNRHNDRIRAFCFSVDAPIPEARLNAWLDMLMGLLGERILRVKAIFNVAEHERPLVAQGVQHVFYPPVFLPSWPDDDRRTRAVFITDGLSKQAIEQTFRMFATESTEPEGTAP